MAKTAFISSSSGRVPPPPPPRIAPPRSQTVNPTPLTDREEKYFKAFCLGKNVKSAKSPRQASQFIEHFFKALFAVERRKWQYILQNYLMMDVLTRYQVREAFLESENWQDYLLPCLSRANKVQGKASTDTMDSLNARDERQLFAFTVNIFVVLFFHNLVNNEKKGSMSALLEDTIQRIAGKCGWSLESRMIVSVILISFLKKIGNTITPFRNSLLDPCWANLHDALGIYYEFFFYRPFRVISGGSPHRNRANRRSVFTPLSSKSKISVLGDRKSTPGINIDATGVTDVIIIEQVVDLLSRHLKVHQIDRRLSSEKHKLKQEKRLIEQWKFEGEVSFYTSLLLYFKHVNTLAASGDSENESYQKILKQHDENTSAIIKLMEKRDKKLDAHRFKEILKSSLSQIIEMRKSMEAVKIGEIAQNLYYGRGKMASLNWKDFGKMTMNLANLASQARRSLRAARRSSTKKKKISNGATLENSLQKRKDNIARYIYTNVFLYGDSQVRVQFFVPHLTKDTKVKLLLDHSARTICMLFYLNEDETHNNKNKSYVLRDTKIGLLQKYVNMPDCADLDRQPGLKKQMNSVILSFHTKRSERKSVSRRSRK